MTKFARYLSVIALFATLAISASAQSISYAVALPNPGWMRMMEVAIPTNGTLTLNPTNLTAKEAWILVGYQTRMSVTNSAATNTCVVNYAPCNFEATPIGAGLSPSNYPITTIGADVAGSEAFHVFTNFPIVRAGDKLNFIFTFTGPSGTIAATNSTALFTLYRIMPYRNNYGLPQT